MTKADGSKVRFVYRGSPILQGITEFNTAIRLGSPGQDDRNLASFVVLEDGRGGLGQRVADVREDLDKMFWSTGVQMTRFQEAILPLEDIQTELTGLARGTYGYLQSAEAHLLESDIDGGTMRYFFAYRDQVWYSDGAGHTMTKVTNDPFTGNLYYGKLIEYEWPVIGAGSGKAAGTRALFVGAFSLTGSFYSENPVTAGTWTLVSGVRAVDFFTFDGKLWAMGVNELKWSIDPADTAQWFPLLGNWPNTWKFVGIFPFGQNNYMPYVLLRNDRADAVLAILDLDNNKLIELDLGVTGIVRARPVNGAVGIVYNQGRSIGMYDPKSNQFRDMGFNGTDRQGFNDIVTAVDIEGHDGKVLAYCHVANPPGSWLIGNVLPTGSQDNNADFIMEFNGAGWHVLMHSTTSPSGLVVPGGQYINHLRDFVYPQFRYGGSTVYLYPFLVAHPKLDFPYTPGQDAPRNYWTGGLYFVTPWYDLGLATLTGALLAVHCGGWFYDEGQSIDVSYQTTLDDEQNDTWHALGSFPNTGAPASPEITGRGEPVEAIDTLLFSPKLQGLSFRRVRFLIQLNNDGTHLQRSPNAFPLTIQFLKRPKMRDSLRFDVDVEQTVASGEFDGPEALMDALRSCYDEDAMLKLEYANRTTYTFMTSFPRVLTPDEMGSDVNEGVGDREIRGGTFVLTYAEPV